jgi:hypothetical protein
MPVAAEQQQAPAVIDEPQHTHDDSSGFTVPRTPPAHVMQSYELPPDEHEIQPPSRPPRDDVHVMHEPRVQFY